MLLFVQNLKSILDSRKISYTRAGRESGAGEEFIRNMERKGSAPSVEKVQQMADYLGVTTSELLGEKKEPGATNGTELVLTQEEARFIGYLRQMTPDQRKALDEKMEFLISMQEAPPAGRE
ncbi:MAG: helix-turn-helix domain-containing protein [Lachnospirales bacterium]